jgi:two-component system, LytTR family, response regulator LytT
MDHIKTLLVDDEFLALNLLEEFVKKLPGLEIVGKAKSPLKALEIPHQQPVDLLFLDIQMPTLSGVNMLRTIKRPPVTIFTTAYSEYAVQAFDLNVADYLLKPFSFERFVQAVNKAREQLRLRNIPESESHGAHRNAAPDFMAVKADGKIVKVPYNDILFIEGLKEYVRIVCRDTRLVTLESLKNLEEILPQDDFLRVHKSYIVAKDKVQALYGNMLEIAGRRIPVSRSKREEVAKGIFG